MCVYSTSNIWGCVSSQHHQPNALSKLLDFGQSDMWEIISQCSFSLHFSYYELTSSIFFCVLTSKWPFSENCSLNFFFYRDFGLFFVSQILRSFFILVLCDVSYKYFLTDYHLSLVFHFWNGKNYLATESKKKAFYPMVSAYLFILQIPSYVCPYSCLDTINFNYWLPLLYSAFVT